MAVSITYIDPLAELLGSDTQTPAPDTGAESTSTPLVSDPPHSEPGAPHPENPTPGVAPSIPAVATESEMSQLIGLTANRVRTLARDGTIVRAGRGRYDVRASLLAYIEDLRAKVSRMGPGAKSTPVTADLNAEKLRLAKQQADKIELQNAASRGELVKATEVEREWAAVLRDVRAGMLAVPSRCGATLSHLNAHDISEIDREIRETLEGLSDGN